MSGDSKTILAECSFCGSSSIRCTDLNEISYNHLMEVTYECRECGHSGTIVIDCKENNKLQINVQ